jgi:hypothetical protein
MCMQHLHGIFLLTGIFQTTLYPLVDGSSSRDISWDRLLKLIPENQKVAEHHSDQDQQQQQHQVACSATNDDAKMRDRDMRKKADSFVVVIYKYMYICI